MMMPNNIIKFRITQTLFNEMASDGSSTLPLPKYLEEHNLTQECKDLLPTLPCEKGWAAPRLHLYHGFWFPTSHLNGVLSSRNNFRARHDDVILATMPKSGTTWLKAILFTLSRHFGRSTGGESSQDPSQLLTANPHDLVPFLEINLYRDDQSPDLSSFSSPRIFATHIPYSLLPESIGDSKCKIVYLCRNVKDTFASTWHFTNKMKPKERGENVLDEVFDQFCKGVNAYGPYWDHLLGYWKASTDMPERVLFLKYEDVKERPVEYTKRLAEFIGCPIEEDDDEVINEITRMCSFESLSKLEVNMNGKLRSGIESKAYFRKGEVGDWMNLLSPQMAERLDCITKERLSGTGLML